MLTGFRTLPLLCKTAHQLPPDVAAMVKDCFVLKLGTCPAWIDEEFLRHLQHFGTESEVIFTVCAVRNIIGAHDWAWLNPPNSDKDEFASVTVTITAYLGGMLWDVKCKQNNAVVIEACDMGLDSCTWQPSILACLTQSRHFFSCPHYTEPIGSLEVPSCLHDWRALFRQFLFSGACAEAHTTCDICILSPPWYMSD